MFDKNAIIFIVLFAVIFIGCWFLDDCYFNKNSIICKILSIGSVIAILIVAIFATFAS